MLTVLTHLPSPALQDCELTFLKSSPIDITTASRQHQQYCKIIEKCGARVKTLTDNLSLPDSVFVEDPVVVFDEVAVLLSMGVASRRDETEALETFFQEFRPIQRISLPARIEGGDILKIDKTIYVGLSPRTNIEGLNSLKTIIEPYGYKITPVKVSGCLHLKTGCTALDNQTLIANPAWVDLAPFQNFKIVETLPEEPFGANVLPIHESLCMNTAFPKTEALIKSLGYRVVSTDISEFVKAEAGLTCMSVPFYQKAAI